MRFKFILTFIPILFCLVDSCFSFNPRRVIRDVSFASNSVASILDFLSNQDGNWLSTEKNVVILLGNNGVGKSTLATLLTDTTNLVSTSSVETGEFLLDDNHRISSDCTTESKICSPELLKDSINNISYYDFAGFDDTKGVRYELTQTYFIRRILDYAESVKLIFVIDYASMKNVGEHKNFLQMAKYATSLIKNIDKYSDGIALVVTKVDNTDVYDEYKKHSIVKLLEEMKKDLSETLSEENAKIIKFIDIIARRSSGYEYTKIGLFRSPNKAGPVKDIPLMQDIRGNLIKIVDKQMNYINSDINDFGFPLSIDSMNTIHDKYDKTINDLKKNLRKLNNEIQQFYVDREKQSIDIFELKQLMQFGCGNFTRINEPSVSRTFYDQIVYTLQNLGISVSGENLYRILRNIEHVNILSQVSDPNAVSMPDLKVMKAMDYLNNSLKWYKFLVNLYESLSTYDVQNRLSTLKPSINRLKLKTNAVEMNVVDIGLESFLDTINNKTYDEIKQMRINRFKLVALNEMLEQMLNKDVSVICYASMLIVTGKFVKISDVKKTKCWSNALDIRVFASNTIFIDESIDKSEKMAQITFIAPTWKVSGEQTINLNGKNATHHEGSAKNGTNTGDKDGKDGENGETGGSAGHFFGIGQRFIDDELLKIHAIGGNGGNGQNGGHGSDGVPNDAPPIDQPSSIPQLWDNMGLNYTKIKEESYLGYKETEDKYWYDVYMDRNAVLPGKGGHGGAGGFGGQAGSISIVGFLQMPNFNIRNSTGKSNT